ncbi:MAG: hypothetical protein ISS45_11965 [Candidatus Omnitrophica bacterium]|nr:hypothetical protein [Candidatus Omnitrophota bacterium]
MDTMDVLLDPVSRLYFPLEKYGYILEKTLNNENRWHIKIVCRILDKNFRRYVSTTCLKQDDYLKLLETTTYLKCNNKLSPNVAKLYPEDKTIVCEYVGDFLSDYLLNTPANISLSLTSIFEYLKDINSINQSRKAFVIPSIVKTALQLSKVLSGDFEFLPRSKKILPKIEKSGIKFTYGYGIEDPHIWNFRILNTQDRFQALTTDYDYFSDRVNYFWELGYFYATFRWFRKISFPLACRSEEILLSLIEDADLKSEFMFWLGALSSYCGYKDSLRGFLKGDRTHDLRKEHSIIKELDEKVAHLASKLIGEQNSINTIYANSYNLSHKFIAQTQRVLLEEKVGK